MKLGVVASCYALVESYFRAIWHKTGDVVDRIISVVRVYTAREMSG
jgi:hypothetical protein